MPKDTAWGSKANIPEDTPLIPKRDRYAHGAEMKKLRVQKIDNDQEKLSMLKQEAERGIVFLNFRILNSKIFGLNSEILRRWWLLLVSFHETWAYFLGF